MKGDEPNCSDYRFHTINGNNLNSMRCEVNRHFRNKRREYLKDKINELATKNVRTRTSETCIEE
jgi:hypothetical protein